MRDSSPRPGAASGSPGHADGCRPTCQRSQGRLPLAYIRYATVTRLLHALERHRP